jgi:GNAT superfamily N-acetyltransferase
MTPSEHVIYAINGAHLRALRASVVPLVPVFALAIPSARLRYNGGVPYPGTEAAGMTAPAAPCIREATEADLPRLMELYFQLSQLGEVPEGEPEPVTNAHRALLRTLQADPRSALYVLEKDGQVIGSLTLYILPNLSHGAHPAAIVENVVIDRHAHRGGHGKMLMDFAEERARQAGCYKLALTSNKRRTGAHAFYRSLGYANSHEGMTKYFG